LRTDSAELPVVDVIDLVIERIGYRDWIDDGSDEGEDRWKNVLELRTVAQEYDDQSAEEGLRSFLENVSLLSETDDLADVRGAVTLMTFHAAKGLEFDTVFMVGMEDGVFPHLRALDDPDQMEEERRLCYVGITRARERLYLVHAARRMLHGNTMLNPQSCFLTDIPKRLWDEQGIDPKSYLRREFTPVSANLFDPQPTPPLAPVEQIFSPGDRVRHKHFGGGTIVSSEMRGADEEVEVEFRSGRGESVTKKLLVTFAGLEAID
ncbi:MAG: 3'-5' exonuclease, partial [Chloroflexota bacterium]